MIPVVEQETVCYEPSHCPSRFLHPIQRDASQVATPVLQPSQLQPPQSYLSDDFDVESTWCDV